MNRQIKIIVSALILIIVLPAVFFAIYEFNSSSNNEKIIRQIYENQLGMIIFSLNSASEDMVSTWGNKLSSYYWEQGKDKNLAEAKIKAFLKQNKTIRFAGFAPVKNLKSGDLYMDGESCNSEDKKTFEYVLVFNKQGINRLVQYNKEGYRKFEPVAGPENPDITYILFISEFTDGPVVVCLGIDSKKFINENLGPKIKASANNMFIVSVFKKNDGAKVYSNDIENNAVYSPKKTIWILPSYEIAIKLKGVTIEEIAQKRINENLLLVAALILLLIAGGIVIFRNIKKEMKLAEIKSEFVSNVSHELRTPLALINMFAETLSMGRLKTEEKKEEYYKIISQEATRLSNIVNKILNFSQSEAGKRKYNFKQADLNEITEKVFNSYQYHLQNKGFKFKGEFAADILDVECDPEAVAEAIINLVDNSVKYSGDTKEINIRTGSNEKFVFVEVADKGIGIPDEDQKRVFEKFFRVSSGLIHNTKGTGLGLAIVKHIMDAHKGRVDLFSKKDEGSRFVLNFNKPEIKP